MSRTTLLLAASALVLMAAGLAPPSAPGFTQSGVATLVGNGIPMGHEWVTRLAGLEVIGGDPLPPDPNDPRRQWPKDPPNGRAKNPDVSSPGAQAELARIRARRTDENRYGSTYGAVLDAILGERWVDIGGFNVTKGKFPGNIDCWDVVAQEAVDAQYDHFMRRWDDSDAAGGVNAALKSQQRFVDYFVAAATAPPTVMRIWDGGGWSELDDVDRNYFLFGRAVHLFQDSFSSEHTVRRSDDMYERVRQVKAYLCARGSEQHTHKTPSVFDYTSGDVVWLPGTSTSPGWRSYKPSFMKPTALVATEASRDLWAAFIRTMGTPPAERQAAATREAQTLVANWLSFKNDEMLKWYDDPSHRDPTYVLASGQQPPGVTIPTCMNTIDPKWKGDQMAAVNKFAQDRLVCLYNVLPATGYSDLYDTSMHMPYNWGWWSEVRWRPPPTGWQPENRPADTGQRVRIKSVANGQYLTVPGGLVDRSAVHARSGPPLDLILVGTPADAYYRATFAPQLFYSYNLTPGDAMLWNGTTNSNYRLDRAGPGHAIFNFYYGQVFWLNGDVPRLDRQGDPQKPTGQWIVEGLR